MVGLARRGGGAITVRVLVVRDNSIPRTTGEGSNLADRTSCGVSTGNGCGTPQTPPTWRSRAMTYNFVVERNIATLESIGGASSADGVTNTTRGHG